MSSVREKIPELRIELQRIKDAPNGAIETAFKVRVLDCMSDPKCWADGLIPVVTYGWQQFQEGYEAASNAPAEEGGKS